MAIDHRTPEVCRRPTMDTVVPSYLLASVFLLGFVSHLKRRQGSSFSGRRTLGVAIIPASVWTSFPDAHSQLVSEPRAPSSWRALVDHAIAHEFIVHVRLAASLCLRSSRISQSSGTTRAMLRAILVALPALSAAGNSEEVAPCVVPYSICRDYSIITSKDTDLWAHNVYSVILMPRCCDRM